MYVGRWYSENAASKSRCEAVSSSRNIVAFCYCYYSHQPTYIVYLNVNNTTSDRNNNRLSTKKKKIHVSTDSKIGETFQ